MNVLLIGGGGREHAMAWKIAQSSLLDELYIAPGNPGTVRHGRNVDLDLKDHAKLRAFLLEKRIRIVVVGPEAPLVDGLHDRIADDPKLAGCHRDRPTQGRRHNWKAARTSRRSSCSATTSPQQPTAPS
jgi:phosphoribosylamine---glycine ligase